MEGLLEVDGTVVSCGLVGMTAAALETLGSDAPEFASEAALELVGEAFAGPVDSGEPVAVGPAL